MGLRSKIKREQGCSTVPLRICLKPCAVKILLTSAPQHSIFYAYRGETTMTRKEKDAIEKKLLMETLIRAGVTFSKNGNPIQLQDVQISANDAKSYLQEVAP